MFLSTVLGVLSLFGLAGQTAHLHLAQGETVPFNKEITNFGATFDSTNAFVCSVAGLYAFHFHALTRSGSEIWLEIFKNGQYLASEYASTTGDYAGAGQGILLHLVEGDRVYVKAHDNYDNAIYGAGDEDYSTFTGVLIRPGIFENLQNNDDAFGFSVGLDHHVVLDGDKVKYNVTITNVTSTQLYLDMYHNDQYVVSAYGFKSDSFADAGNTVILYIHAGDKIYIKGSDNEAVQLFGDPTQIYNTFSGALLSGTYTPQGNQVPPPEVAFSVGSTVNLNGNLTSDHKIKYDRIFTNLGNAYNPNTGVFTCRYSGIYVFHFHALSQLDKPIYIDLYHNYLYVDSLYGHNPGGYAAGSNTAVIELLSGDTVYLDESSYNSFEYGGVYEVYSTFSGYFLAPQFNYHAVIG
ncbi:hypothetical protein KUTeg_001563 [Tegillarca granosa]|uniref:C1q domain-containing protein n=1 Tax=Tegillarca granosa TaxID=220873 RepID=A0ABQ9FV03_TEGGR|nr:hypothetical protein KUTeg_001563 [Tegillarca granosa]